MVKNFQLPGVFNFVHRLETLATLGKWLNLKGMLLVSKLKLKAFHYCTAAFLKLWTSFTMVEKSNRNKSHINGLDVNGQSKIKFLNGIKVGVRVDGEDGYQKLHQTLDHNRQ